MRAVSLAFGGAVAALAIGFAVPASAKPARCFTTDDGYYNCNFKGLDSLGSFRISASGYPTITIEVDQPGFAYGYADFGGRNVPLPGQFVRQRDDGACWGNPETNTKVCAW